MRLKRGTIRSSCDVCHQRKIKCDRPARLANGHDGCSQCSIRQTTCSIDSSTDVRLQARKDSNSPLEESNTVAPLRSGANDEHLQAPSSYLAEDYFLDLNTESLQFLDSIFGEMHTPITQDPFSDIGPLSSSSVTDIATNGRTTPYYEPSLGKDLWTQCNVDRLSFLNTISGYFQFASTALPVLLEDAFWMDYHGGLASDALTYAVACRGLPFSTLAGNDEIQQHLASRFKESFLQAHATSVGQGAGQLDNIEALAIMAGFVYNQASTAQRLQGLESLYLSHDSLVMMALQYRLQNGDKISHFAKERERASLLFWHVYGLDAFHTLDQKLLSRISDQEAELVPNIQKPDSVGYLDAILAQAQVARHLSRLLGSSVSRQRGIRPRDVQKAYHCIEVWRYQTCPGHLLFSDIDSDDMKESGGPVETGYARHHSIQRAVLALLEINLLLQIENYTEEYSLQSTETPFERYIVVSEIRYKTLQAIHRASRLIRWIVSEGNKDPSGFSIRDLLPDVITNILVGICYWTCMEASKRVDQSCSCGVHQCSEEQSINEGRMLLAISGEMRKAAGESKVPGALKQMLGDLQARVEMK